MATSLITVDKLNFKKSQRMTQTYDGGGFITSNNVIDGQSNNVFDDISALDLTVGSVDLSKLFLSVDTLSTDTFYGSNVIVASNPENKNVNGIVFTTADWSDTRQAAQTYVENYLVKSYRIHGQILELQIRGSMNLQLLQKPRDAPPEVGDTLYLVTDEGKSTEYSEYVRIVKIDTYLREFNTQEGGLFTGRVVNCTLTNRLQHDYDGGPATPFDDVSGRSLARETRVLDAARYYGCKKVKRATEIGDLRINVDSIFGQLVPASQSEIALEDQSAGGENQAVVKSGQMITFTYIATLSNGSRIFLGNGCLPGTLNITVSGGSLTDRDGQLFSGNTVIGTVDYATGVIAFGVTSGVYAGTKIVSFNAAAAPIRIANTASQVVDESTQGLVWIQTLNPRPAPAATSFSYRAQGKWYTLRDLGNGVLTSGNRDDDAFGVGTINYATGTVSVTVTAMPDLNSMVIFSWSPYVSYFDHSGTFTNPPAFRYSLKQQLTPNEILLTWDRLGVAKTAQDDGNGNIVGDATGTVNYRTGEIILNPTQLVAPNTSIATSYSFDVNVSQMFSEPSLDINGYANLQLEKQNVKPNTVFLDFNTVVLPKSTGPIPPPVSLRDTGIARLKDDGNGNIADYTGVVWGTIDYATGVIRMKLQAMISTPFPIYLPQNVMVNGNYTTVSQMLMGWAYEPHFAIMPPTGGFVNVNFNASTAAEVTNIELTSDMMQLNVVPTISEQIVRNSLSFTFGGKRYVDRSGQLHMDINPATGVGTIAGSVNYGTNTVVLWNWDANGPNTGHIESLLTQIGDDPVDFMVMRIPTAPIRVGSFQIRATQLDGTNISAAADNNNKINGYGIIGDVDTVTGIVNVRFGNMVSAAGNEAEWWFDVNNIVDGQIFKPMHVLSDSILYNAVSTAWLPLDPEILGLNPVRLPNDGKVPIYRAGDVAVIHEDIEVTVPRLTINEIFDLELERITSVTLVDAYREKLPDTMYDVDLDTGIIVAKQSMASVAEPITAICRIEDMSMITDVFIDGTLNVNRPITHRFSQAAMCSGALVIDNLFARYSSLFSQKVWNNVWMNVPDAPTTTSRYNDIDYPVFVQNADAAQESWALIFTSATAFRIVGKALGEIGTGTVLVDCAPVNPNTKRPYFILKYEGWGGGWASGNVLRFDSYAANFPFWCARTVLASQPTIESDSFKLQIRGDINRD